MAWRSVLVATIAAGCGVEDEADYVASRADAECTRLQACALGYFESEYGDAEDCVDERADDLDEAGKALEDAGCDFELDEAGACVTRIRSLSCEDWAENDHAAACDLVWTCEQIPYTYYGYGYDYGGGVPRGSP